MSKCRILRRPTTALQSCAGIVGGRRWCTCKAGLAAKLAGLLALGHTPDSVAKGRGLRVQQAPNGAKATDVVVFAHRGRALGVCGACFLTFPHLFLALDTRCVPAPLKADIALGLASVQGGDAWRRGRYAGDTIQQFRARHLKLLKLIYMTELITEIPN